MQDIGSRCRWARETAGLSRRRLAAEADLSTGYLSALERRRIVAPTSEVALRLARVLGVDLTWLIAGVGAAPDSATLASVGAALRGRAL